MYNDARINRAEALEQLNKFFLGKDEQIPLSDLRPLHSPQVMPRGYQDLPQAMPRGYQDGAAVTPDTVTRDISIRTDANSTDRQTFSIEYNTRTGFPTQKSIDAVKNALGISQFDNSHTALQDFSRPNFSIMSKESLTELKEILTQPEDPKTIEQKVKDFFAITTENLVEKAATSVLPASFITGPMLKAIGKAIQTGDYLDSTNIALDNIKDMEAQFRAEKEAYGSTDVEPTAPPTQPQPQSVVVPQPEVLPSVIPGSYPYSEAPLAGSARVGDPTRTRDQQRDHLDDINRRQDTLAAHRAMIPFYTGKGPISTDRKSTIANTVVPPSTRTPVQSGIEIASFLRGTIPINTVATISDSDNPATPLISVPIRADSKPAPVAAPAAPAAVDPSTVSAAPVAAVAPAVSDAPTFLGLPVEHSYPGTTRSYSRSEFAPQDAEGYSGAGVDVSTGPGTADPGTVGFGPADPGPNWARGGPVNMQEGGEIDNADTDLESRFGPMGVIRDPDGAPGPSRGGAGVSDDLTMEVPVGSYVLNSDAVERIGSTYINDKIKEAYDVALASGQEVPADYNPEDKVVIRISNGEALIPKPLVGPIGQRLLEKWNNEGLKVRAKRKQEEEKMMAQQKLQGPQVASEAPPVQPQSPIQAQMGGLMGYKEGDKVEEEDDLLTQVAEFLGLRELWESKELTESNLQEAAKKLFIPTIKKKHGGSVNFNKNYLKVIEKHRGKDHNEDPDFFEAAGTYITNNKNNPKLSEPALLYNAIHSAEWRSRSDTKLRNKNDTYRFTGFDKLNKKGLASSAFGPVQLTYSRINTLLDKYGGSLSPELKNYAEKLVLQGKLRNNSISRQETLSGNTLPPKDTAFYEAGIDRDRELLNMEHEVDRKKGIGLTQKTFKERIYDPRLSGRKEGLISREEHKEHYRDLADIHIRDHVMTTKTPPKPIPKPKIERSLSERIVDWLGID